MTTREKINRSAFETFLAEPENAKRLFELIDGEIVEKMPTQLHGWITAILTHAIMAFLLDSPIGWILVEARYGLPEDEENDRIPDLSFVREERSALVSKGAAPYMPDLAIEVQSPDDSLVKMVKNANYYLTNGTQMVLLVYTEKQLIEVLTATTRDILTLEDTLDGGDVLPGFSIPVRQIFRSK